MKRRWLAAGAMAALLLTACSASARQATETGILSAGDYTITKTFAGWKPFTGNIVFDGGGLTGVTATFSTAAQFRRAVYPDPITFTLVPIETECSATVGLTCTFPSPYGSTAVDVIDPFGASFSFPPGLSYNDLAPPPTPDSDLVYWYSDPGVSTLKFHFAPGTGDVSYTLTYDARIPEPGAWALMVGGFGLAGAAIRRRTVARARRSF